ncbi:FAD binding domain-containing protein [uncultured Methylobacterium sp.]|uniref:FAD binding domain-containing protein n=1 Tax=uncultured Methylobacterium sp. TaxID=157278 RepID=UPI0035CC7BF7
MIAADFDYARPSSLREALGLLERPGAVPLAGGQSLLPLLADRSVVADLLVDIGRLAELRRVARDRDWLVIGAGATLAAVMTAEAAKPVPLLAEALRSVGSAAIRNRGTLVGNLVSASPNSELSVAMVALDARFVLRHRTGDREVAAADFFLGPHRTVLTAGELVTELRIASPTASRALGGFAEVSVRAGAPPLCCVAVVLAVDETAAITDVRVAAGGITGAPARWHEAEAALRGHPLSENVARLAQCGEPSLVLSLDLPEAAYARDVLPVLTRRAVAAAATRFIPNPQPGIQP